LAQGAGQYVTKFHVITAVASHNHPTIQSIPYGQYQVPPYTFSCSFVSYNFTEFRLIGTLSPVISMQKSVPINLNSPLHHNKRKRLHNFRFMPTSTGCRVEITWLDYWFYLGKPAVIRHLHSLNKLIMADSEQAHFYNDIGKWQLFFSWCSVQGKRCRYKHKIQELNITYISPRTTWTIIDCTFNKILPFFLPPFLYTIGEKTFVVFLKFQMFYSGLNSKIIACL